MSRSPAAAVAYFGKFVCAPSVFAMNSWVLSSVAVTLCVGQLHKYEGTKRSGGALVCFDRPQRL